MVRSGPGDQRVMHLSSEVRVLYLDPSSRGGGALHGLSGRHLGPFRPVGWPAIVQLASMVTAFSASDLSQILCYSGIRRVHNFAEPMVQYVPIQKASVSHLAPSFPLCSDYAQGLNFVLCVHFTIRILQPN